MVSKIFYFHPYLGKISNLTCIFFRWVGSTTNQVSLEERIVSLATIFQGGLPLIHSKSNTTQMLLLLLLMVQKSSGHQLRLVVYLPYSTIIYRVLYIPGGCLGFLPSTVLSRVEQRRDVFLLVQMIVESCLHLPFGHRMPFSQVSFLSTCFVHP